MSGAWKGVPTEQRFWAKVDVRAPEDCWEWKSSRFGSGYGVFKVVNLKEYRKRVRAHRYSYELCRGPIPAGMFVCHHCDNPPCVNPAHLFLGTPADNVHDQVRKGRYVSPVFPRDGEHNGRAKLTCEIVGQCRSRYQAGGVTFRELGMEFGVTPEAIREAVRGKTWKSSSA